MDERLSEHLSLLEQLLRLERAAEQRRFEDVTAHLSLREREARGLALADLWPKDEGGLAGRAQVTFEAERGAELSGGEIGVGSPVQAVPRRPPIPEDAPKGIVARRSRTQIAVVFDEPPPEWVTDGRLALIALPSSATFDRLSAGLSRAREAKRWWAPLGGALRFERRPEPLPETFARQLSALNPEQQAAVLLAERAEDLALVHGPPGTGKTTVLVEVIRRAVARGESVLACAPSNLAVDNLAERLAAAGLHTVRVGHPARLLPSVVDQSLDVRVRGHETALVAQELTREAFALRATARKRKERRGPGRFSEAREAEREARRLLSEARDKFRQAERAVLERAQVVLATLTGVASRALEGRSFALAVVDEATQATEPAALLALLRGERAVLAGDHLQLPPTILSEEAQAKGLGLSLFERLARACPAAVQMLRTQHRMHEAIQRFPSQQLYGGLLQAHPDVAKRALDDAPLLVVDTAGKGFEEATPEGSESKMNPGEAELAAAEARALLATGLPAGELALIAPYEAHVRLLRQQLSAEVAAGVEVDTVDGFQGREKDAVIVCLVRSNDQGEVGFLAEVRRMNVALTRARKKLIVIGDGATVTRHPFYDAFFEHARATSAWVSAWER